MYRRQFNQFIAWKAKRKPHSSVPPREEASGRVVLYTSRSHTPTQADFHHTLRVAHPGALQDQGVQLHKPAVTASHPRAHSKTHFAPQSTAPSFRPKHLAGELRAMGCPQPQQLTRPPGLCAEAKQTKTIITLEQNWRKEEKVLAG